MRFVTTRRYIVEQLGQAIAEYHKRADEYYYTKHNQEMSSWYLDKVAVIRSLACNMGIVSAVYAHAYGIYDFHNSGRKGYTLKDGRIVKDE